MAINMTTVAKPASSARKSDQPPAEFWMNIGFYMPDEETGELIWVSLGGVPMSEPDGSYSGNSKIVAARNEYLSNLIAAGRNGLEPGQEDAFTGLEMRMRRVAIGEHAVKPAAGVAKAIAGIKLGSAA